MENPKMPRLENSGPVQVALLRALKRHHGDGLSTKQLIVRVLGNYSENGRTIVTRSLITMASRGLVAKTATPGAATIWRAATP
jgi:hypothetical protein